MSPHVRHDKVLPGRVAHVLPARRLRPDHQAKLVAGVEEMRRLRVVRAADHVAVQLVPEDLGVPALQPRGRRPGRRRGTADAGSGRRSASAARSGRSRPAGTPPRGNRSWPCTVWLAAARHDSVSGRCRAWACPVTTTSRRRMPVRPQPGHRPRPAAVLAGDRGAGVRPGRPPRAARVEQLGGDPYRPGRQRGGVDGGLARQPRRPAVSTSTGLAKTSDRNSRAPPAAARRGRCRPAAGSRRRRRPGRAVRAAPAATGRPRPRRARCRPRTSWPVSSADQGR